MSFDTSLLRFFRLRYALQILSLSLISVQIATAETDLTAPESFQPIYRAECVDIAELLTELILATAGDEQASPDGVGFTSASSTVLVGHELVRILCLSQEFQDLLKRLKNSSYGICYKAAGNPGFGTRNEIRRILNRFLFDNISFCEGITPLNEVAISG